LLGREGAIGSIVLITGDGHGGPKGGVKINVDETVSRIALMKSPKCCCHPIYSRPHFVTICQRETYDVCASIEFKTGYNPNTSSGAFRVQTADAGRRGNSGEVSLRTGKANQGDSGSVLFETGPAISGEGGEWSLSARSLPMCVAIF